jgi:hypothetical protein
MSGNEQATIGRLGLRDRPVVKSAINRDGKAATSSAMLFRLAESTSAMPTLFPTLFAIWELCVFPATSKSAGNKEKRDSYS